MVSNTRAPRGLLGRSAVVAALAVALAAIFASVALAASVDVRVEGAQRTYFSGAVPLGARDVVDFDGVAHTQVRNPLGALDFAAQLGGFPFVLENHAWGLLVSSVGGELAVPEPPYPGWMYRVNGVSPSVGADKFDLDAGDSVLWYYGAWDASPTAVALPRPYVPVDTTTTVVAQQLDMGGAASALESATVTVGRHAMISAADGTARVKLSAPGDYGVRVSKDGFVRSAVEVLRVRYTTKLSSLAASRTLVARGARVTLAGRLTGVGKAPGRRTVSLQARKAGTTKWTSIARATTSTSGSFRFSVKPAASMQYRAAFAGDERFAAAQSTVRSIRVR